MNLHKLNGLIWGAVLAGTVLTQGQCMTEAAAKAGGGRPDHGKSCS